MYHQKKKLYVYIYYKLTSKTGKEHSISSTQKTIYIGSYISLRQ